MNRAKRECPDCHAKSTYGNINIQDNNLIQKCEICGASKSIILPALDKKIVYLDLSLYINAKKKDPIKEFEEILSLLVKLTSQQLLVCPYSDVHETETQFWSKSKDNKLLQFIKNTAKQLNFKDRYWIKLAQIYIAFKKYIESKSTTFVLDEVDVFYDNVNEWKYDDEFEIPTYFDKDELENIQSSKENATNGLISLLKNWRATKATFDEDYKKELDEYLKNLKLFYAQKIVAYKNGDINGYLNSPQLSGIIENLMLIDESEMDDVKRWHRINDFFVSEYFANIPFVKIYAYLLAKLKQKVRQEPLWLNNIDKAKKELSGLYFDLEYLSIFAPYCNAIFTDNAMAVWINQFLKDSYNNFNCDFKVFSAFNVDNFKKYLSEIESQKSTELMEGLKQINSEF